MYELLDKNELNLNWIYFSLKFANFNRKCAFANYTHHWFSFCVERNSSLSQPHQSMVQLGLLKLPEVVEAFQAIFSLCGVSSMATLVGAGRRSARKPFSISNSSCAIWNLLLWCVLTSLVAEPKTSSCKKNIYYLKFELDFLCQLLTSSRKKVIAYFPLHKYLILGFSSLIWLY